MDILSYINKMNRLYGNDTKVASNPLGFPEHMIHQYEGGQLSPEEFYQHQSIPQSERPLTGAEGGRVYDTRKYFKPGGLVEPGVTHYGKKTRIDTDTLIKIFNESKDLTDNQTADKLNKKYLTERGKTFTAENIFQRRKTLGIKTGIIRPNPATPERTEAISKFLANEVRKANQGDKFVKQTDLMKKAVIKFKMTPQKRRLDKRTGSLYSRYRLDTNAYPILQTLETGAEKIDEVLKRMLISEEPLDDLWYRVVQKKTGLERKWVGELLRSGKVPTYNVIEDQGADFIVKNFAQQKDLLKNLSFSDQLSKATRMKEGRPVLSVGGEFSRGYNRPKFNVFRYAFQSWDQNRGQGDIKFFDKPVGGEKITWDYGNEVNKRLKNSSFSYKGKRYNLTNLDDTDILKKAFPEVYERTLQATSFGEKKIDNPFKPGSKIKVKDLIKKIQVDGYKWQPGTGTINILHGPEGVKGEPFTNLRYNTYDINKIESVLANKLNAEDPNRRISRSTYNKAMKELNSAFKGLSGSEYEGAIIKRLGTQVKEIQEFKGKGKPLEIRTLIEALVPDCGKATKASGGRIGFQSGSDTCFRQGQKKMNTLLISGAGTQTERSLLARIIQGGAALMKGFSPKEMLKAKNLFGLPALGFMGAFEAGLIGDEVIRKNVPIKEALGKNWVTGAFMPRSGEGYQVDEMRKQGLLINPGAKTYAKGIELQDKYNQLTELLSDLEDPVSGYKAIEPKLAAELKVDSIADVRNEMEKIVNEYNEVTRDGVVMEEGSSAQIEFMQDADEYEATRLAKTEYSPIFGELGTPLKPEITRPGTRIGPGTAQQIEKDFTPKTYASTQISETPLPEESIRNVRDYLRHVGYIKPRDELPKAMVDYLQTQEKMTQAMKLPGMLGTQERFNTGGRVPFVKGKLVDEGRRAFMKWLAGITGAGVAAGTGLIKWGAKKGTGKTIVKAGDHIIQGTPGMPDWFIPLVNRIVREGDDVTAKLATVEREIVHTKKIEGHDVDVYQNLDTGNIRVSVEGNTGKNLTAYDEGLQLEYTAPMEDITSKGKPFKTKSDFSVEETEAGYYRTGPNDADLEISPNIQGQPTKFDRKKGTYVVDETKATTDGILSDTNFLKNYAKKKKPNMGQIVETTKKKKEIKHLNKNPHDDPRIPEGPEADYYDDFLPGIDDID